MLVLIIYFIEMNTDHHPFKELQADYSSGLQVIDISMYLGGGGDGGSEDSSAAGGGEGCFIATAAYGSSVSEELTTLRRFRDSALLRSSLRRALAKSYYKVAPPLAACIGEHEILRTATRLALTPLVYGVKYPKASALIFLSSILAITLRLRRSSRF